jgi:hypothetical protein
MKKLNVQITEVYRKLMSIKSNLDVLCKVREKVKKAHSK